jgi:hypothetical protein
MNDPMDEIIKQLNDTLVKKHVYQDEIKKIEAAKLKLRKDEESLKIKISINESNRTILIKKLTIIQAEEDETNVMILFP